ncbi:MAG TPA: M48 family metallopeptidase [Spirochaetota bacterium]|nr:M48 family metallopeptidase [Spirochaetota bacterium]HOS39022.1 M48 family metallopeptidase [Spirochaetota bacterium]HPI21823.1 M48 family metallopeptidase [Spirochaetota bacterium]HPU88053.1 M48 family metallopeptidase [Spirochaetota bacterium]
MLDVKSLRYHTEKDYLVLSIVFGMLYWILLIVLTFGIIIPIVALVALGLWIFEQFLKAMLFGDAIRVSENQYPELNAIVVDQCRELGMSNAPSVFIVNGQGMINAMAVRVLSKRYVILLSDLVDLMLARDQIRELAMIIGHELAHHAAGHLDPKRNLAIAPARFIPFLGTAYSRACEYTCDRIGYALIRDKAAAQRALIAVALGARTLASKTNIDAFAAQEREVPRFFGVLTLIFSTHPRMTLRIRQLEGFEPK